jgi:toluene monooxygenase system ferredoxin subunit
MTWHSLGSLDDLWEGDMVSMNVDSHELLVMRLDGGDVHVYQGICPHQDQKLVDGDLTGNVLTCLGHMWQFDVTSGQGVNPKNCKLSRYPTEVVDGDIRVSTVGVTPLHSF